MIAPAILYADALTKLHPRAMFEKRTNFYSLGSWRSFKLIIADDDWANIQRVSVRDEEVHGFLSASIDRDIPSVSELSAISYRPGSPTFARDLAAFVGGLCVDRWERVAWSVVIGNPIEPMYDRMCERLGGRIIGTQRRYVRTHDGVLRDRKLYEVIPSEVPNAERIQISKALSSRRLL